MKKIHIFGTSFSSGGGFYWGEPHYHDPLLQSIYKFIDEPKTIDNFSWPGQMKRLIKDKEVEVINHARWGYGNELTYRKIFEITNDVGFKKEDNLFLIEWSYFGRKEFYSNKLKNYFILNYNYTNGETSVTEDYMDFSESDERKERIKYLENLIESSKDFLTDTLYYNSEHHNEGDIPFIRNACYLVSYLNYNNLNYLYTNPPVVDSNRVKNGMFSWFKDNDKREETIRYTMGNGEAVVEGFSAFFNMPEHEKFNFHIRNETRGILNDLHMGLWASKIVAQQTYNRLIDEGWINGEHAPLPDKPIINYEEMKNI